MKLENCKRRVQTEAPKNIGVCVRLTSELSKWLRAQDLSPTAIFYEAVKELGYKPASN